MNRFLTITLAALSLTAYAANLMPINWTADGSKPVAAALSLAQGETRDLVCTLKNYGAAVAVSNAATASLYYQTNGMGSTYWDGPATVTTNGVITATWSPSLDVGSSAYNFALGVSIASNRIYTAYGILRMRKSPGWVPNALALPTSVIDFDSIEVLNAPWATPADIATATGALHTAISAETTSATGALHTAISGEINDATVSRAGSAGKLEATLGADAWVETVDGTTSVWRVEQTGTVQAYVVSVSTTMLAPLGTVFYSGPSNTVSYIFTNATGHLDFYYEEGSFYAVESTILGVFFQGTGNSFPGSAAFYNPETGYDLTVTWQDVPVYETVEHTFALTDELAAAVAGLADTNDVADAVADKATTNAVNAAVSNKVDSADIVPPLYTPTTAIDSSALTTTVTLAASDVIYRLNITNDTAIAVGFSGVDFTAGVVTCEFWIQRDATNLVVTMPGTNAWSWLETPDFVPTKTNQTLQVACRAWLDGATTNVQAHLYARHPEAD